MSKQNHALFMRTDKSFIADIFNQLQPFDNSNTQLTQDYNQAVAYLNAIGASGENCNFRAIHDQDKGRPAIKRDGTLEQHWRELCNLNAQGYGIFVTVAQMDGQGDKLSNVAAIRAHYLDLDSVQAAEDLERAKAHFPPPQFVVQSSPGKFHVYWTLAARYNDNAWFDQQQRKLAQLYGGDPRVHDAARVMRLPGCLHLKGAPHLVTCWQLPGWSVPTDPQALATSVQHVNVVHFSGGLRKPLGDPDLAAPSADWLAYALRVADPNDMDRDDWISFTAAWKQAASTLLDPDDAFAQWSQWCEQYDENDPDENLKQWSDLTETQVGWNSIENRFATVKAARIYSKAGPPAVSDTASPMPTVNASGQAAATGQQDGQPTGDMLTAEEQAIWFKDCVLISAENRILCADNVFRDPGAFNSAYGGKLFILDEFGKVTDEAWKAATRGRVFNVPRAQFTCFRPDLDQRAIVSDELGREYVNTYQPANVRRQQGDPSIFIDHLCRILPDEQDRETLLDFMAHNLKYPGHKIPWSILLQSAEGVGKGAIKRIMRHGIGRMYFYEPKARELAESGAKFNEWQENKLFLLVDEVKTDDKREMVEILKPFITETELEIQGKGKDQRMGDTPGNWLFFSNHKDAIPISKNGRRFAIFYSALQSAEEIRAAGMGDDYFNRLYGWLDKQGGCEIVTDWLMRRPVERGALPSRAPHTSSTAEAIEESRGWLELMILDLIEQGRRGFIGGWVNVTDLRREIDSQRRTAADKTIATCLRSMGFYKIGRLQTAGEARSYVWHKNRNASLMNYIGDQMPQN